MKKADRSGIWTARTRKATRGSAPSSCGEPPDGSAAGVGGGRRKLKLKPRPEGEIQRAILLALGVELRSTDTGKPSGVFVTRSGDGMFWRQNCGAMAIGSRFVRFAPNGTADILGCVAGAFVALEVKREGEKQSDAQIAWQSVVEDSGGIYRVVRSVSEALAVVEEVRRA